LEQCAVLGTIAATTHRVWDIVIYDQHRVVVSFFVLERLRKVINGKCVNIVSIEKSTDHDISSTIEEDLLFA
jgi:hypothetical protein